MCWAEVKFGGKNQPQLARLHFSSSPRDGFLGSSVCPYLYQAQCPVFLLESGGSRSVERRRALGL